MLSIAVRGGMQPLRVRFADSRLARSEDDDSMKCRGCLSLVLLYALGSAAHAERVKGWEVGYNVIYQDAQAIQFNGGSSLSLKSDIGVALAFNYRFNSRFNLHLGLDWNAVDYGAIVAPGTVDQEGFAARGSAEYLTPTVGAEFNLLKGDLTPFIAGNLGWAFLDTSIADAPRQLACWWDPWAGQYCGAFQSTRTVSALVYNVGIGLRWDIRNLVSLHAGYSKHWLNLSQATSTPSLDHYTMGVMVRY